MPTLRLSLWTVLLALVAGCPSRTAVTRETGPADCVVRGRLASFASAYADSTSGPVIYGLFGDQQVESVTPPAGYGRRVEAVLSWPVVGRVWLGSARIFALRERLPLPEYGLEILPGRYLDSVRRSGVGRVTIRLDLGQGASPRHVEREVACADLTLGTFEPRRPFAPAAPTRVFLTEHGKDAPLVPLRLSPEGEPVLTLPMYSTRIVGKRDGWLQVADERSPFAYSGWVPAGTVPAADEAAPGGLVGMAGGILMSGAQEEERPWAKTVGELELRREASHAAVPVATLARDVPVRILDERDGFVRLEIEPVSRSKPPQRDESGFFVVAGSPGLPVRE